MAAPVVLLSPALLPKSGRSPGALAPAMLRVLPQGSQHLRRESPPRHPPPRLRHDPPHVGRSLLAEDGGIGQHHVLSESCKVGAPALRQPLNAAAPLLAHGVAAAVTSNAFALSHRELQTARCPSLLQRVIYKRWMRSSGIIKGK